MLIHIDEIAAASQLTGMTDLTARKRMAKAAPLAAVRVRHTMAG